MATPTFSAKLPDVTIRQLNELSAQFGVSKSQIVIQAVRQLYQQEKKNMTTATLTIKSIDTKPVHDPYTNITGVASRTYLKLAPRDRTVWVTQEYNDHATPSDEWHGLVLTWRVPHHPTEAAMREWIEENLPRLQRICDGYEVVWNGSNYVGRLTDDAGAIRAEIEFELDNGGDGYFSAYYEYWSIEMWTAPVYGDITATTTDEELRQMAKDAIDALEDNQILDYDEDGVYNYYLKRRNNLAEKLGDDE